MAGIKLTEITCTDEDMEKLHLYIQTQRPQILTVGNATVKYHTTCLKIV